MLHWHCLSQLGLVTRADKQPWNRQCVIACTDGGLHITKGILPINKMPVLTVLDETFSAAVCFVMGLTPRFKIHCHFLPLAVSGNYTTPMQFAAASLHV